MRHFLKASFFLKSEISQSSGLLTVWELISRIFVYAVMHEVLDTADCKNQLGVWGWGSFLPPHWKSTLFGCPAFPFFPATREDNEKSKWVTQLWTWCQIFKLAHASDAAVWGLKTKCSFVTWLSFARIVCERSKTERERALHVNTWGNRLWKTS